MVELLGRVPPIQLSRGQSLLVVGLVAVAVLAAVVAVFFDNLLYRAARLALRVRGHPAPSKSPARIALEDLEQRVRPGQPPL
jgi:hypothetical protein